MFMCFIDPTIFLVPIILSPRKSRFPINNNTLTNAHHRKMDKGDELTIHKKKVNDQ